jgi:aryl-alcohol dehydrogenase-like predicted oxidoreductase
MLYRNFGNAEFKVSVLGFGAGMLGDEHLLEKDAEQLLNRVVDLGITLIDTAHGYGGSEERIGKHLRHRRQEIHTIPIGRMSAFKPE